MAFRHAHQDRGFGDLTKPGNVAEGFSRELKRCNSLADLCALPLYICLSMKPKKIALLKIALLLICLPLALSAEENHFIAANDVAWDSLGTNETNSMQIGNGDIALNVWTEQNGDIVLLIAKSDAWSENGQLLKLGRGRVRS